MCKTQLTATPPHSYRKAQWSPASCGTLRQRSKGVLRKSGVRRRTTNGAQGSSRKRGITFGVDASTWTHAHEDYDRSCIRVSKLHRSGKEWRDIMAAKKRNTPEYNIYCLGADKDEEEPASPLPSWDSYYASWRGRADVEEDAHVEEEELGVDVDDDDAFFADDADFVVRVSVADNDVGDGEKDIDDEDDLLLQSAGAGATGKFAWSALIETACAESLCMLQAHAPQLCA